MDEWGAAPSVQRMRKIFSAMEEIDNALIKSIKLSPFDTRLREIRVTSRELFEKAFSHLAAKINHLNDKTVIELYRQCHISTFKEKGISVPDPESDKNDELKHVIKEVSK